MIITVIIGFIIGTAITKPIKQIDGIVQDTADFNFKSNPASQKLYKHKDEAGHMALSIHEMRKNPAQYDINHKAGTIRYKKYL